MTSVVEIDGVVRELPDGSAFVGYTFLSPDAAEVRTTSDAFGYRYAAFVLRPDGAVRFHALGDGARIDSLVVTYRQSMARFDPSRVGADQQRRDEARLKTIARQLHDELVAPLGLDDAQTLFMALEGLLNVLPFEVLVDADGTYLLDRHRFAYLNSGRDLLEMGQRHHENGLMYVFADPDFETSPTESTYEQAPVPPQDGSAVRSEDLTSAHFERLAGTAAEAQVVADLFDLDERHVFRGAQASEAHFANLPAPWRLHVATHGFFLADQPRPENPFSIGYPLQQAATGPLARYESPLLRSGLALAGANRVGQARAEEDYDGIVTAYEVANLNLQSTDLVVLSACETGVGTVRNGEGVFGLRRAFRMAGARTLIMSLWSVSDAATRDIMTEFYTRLKQGQTKAEALREAAMVLRAREDYAHPYYWGAFILSGDPD